jgi:hypothetical protein
MRGGRAGAGDGDERDRAGGDPVPVALECYQVVVVDWPLSSHLTEPRNSSCLATGSLSALKPRALGS